MAQFRGGAVQRTTTMTHSELVKRAERWLRKTKNCKVVITETASAYSETPDAIGWRGIVSHLVECKVSRGDYKADAKKFFRHQTKYGMGQFRWYLTPKGLLKPEELPALWGLLECTPKQVRVKVEAFRFDDYRALAERALLIEGAL